MKSLHQEVADGSRSQSVLDELNERFAWMEQNIHNKWAACDNADIDGQHLLKLQLNALKQLTQSFINDANTGKLAEEQLRIEDSQKDSNK